MVPTSSETKASSSWLRPCCTLLLTAAVIALMVGLRVVALDSDAYPRLSWSGALLTDEGFYIHNARNIALFGHARTDQFNNMLIMPTLHQVQTWVFRLFGAGAVQARSISVGCGLLCVLLFYLAMRLAFPRRVAAAGALFLGLGHANLLYSRMALMDTPAALGMVAVLYAWLGGARMLRESRRAGLALFALSGALLALTVITRGLTVWFVPVPLGILARHARKESQTRAAWMSALRAMAAGLCSVMVVYLCVWYLPQRAEISRMSGYYLFAQLAPRSIRGLWETATHAFIGDSRGVAPYLFRHSPVELCLALALLAATFLPAARLKRQAAVSALPREPEKPVAGDENGRSDVARIATGFLACWLIIGWCVYAVVSYAPDRYYVLFYPALAGLAGCALFSVPAIWNRLNGRPEAMVLGAFIAYHAGEALLHHSNNLLLAAVTISGAAAFARRHDWRSVAAALAAAPACLLAVWLLVNTCWTADWLTHLSYARRDADRWLAVNLPAGSVLVGDVAPGLCLDNRFECVSVIPGLCNADHPLEMFRGRPTYIVILDERFIETYWKVSYPQDVTPGRLVRQFRSIIRFPVGVFQPGS